MREVSLFGTWLFQKPLRQPSPIPPAHQHKRPVARSLKVLRISHAVPLATFFELGKTGIFTGFYPAEKALYPSDRVDTIFAGFSNDDFYKIYYTIEPIPTATKISNEFKQLARFRLKKPETRHEPYDSTVSGFLLSMCTFRHS